MESQIYIIIFLSIVIITLQLYFVFFKKNDKNIESKLDLFSSSLNRIEGNLKEDFRVNREESNNLAKENRDELNNTLKDFKKEISENLKTITEQNQNALEKLTNTLEQKLSALTEKTEQNSKDSREQLAISIKEFSETNSKALEKINKQVEDKLKDLNEQAKVDALLMRSSLEDAFKGFGVNFEKSINSFNELQKEKFADLEKRQNDLILNTETKLESIRVTVEEKLEKTLSERLGQSFETVGKQLIEVQKVRNLARQQNWGKETIVLESNVNQGLAKAIISGVSEIVEKHGRIIVLEDDLVTSPYFLNYINTALNKYENDDEVISVVGFSYPINFKDDFPDTYFIKNADCLGWATWKRAWNKFEFNTQFDSTINADEMISNFYQNKAISKWFIRYYRESLSPNASAWSPHWIFSIIRNNGLSVTPIANLVQNIGFTSDSTHASSKSFQAFNDFKIGGLPDLPDPEDIAVENLLDKLRFQVTRKTDPNLFIMRRAKIFILPKIYSISSPRIKKRVKKYNLKKFSE